MSMVTRPWYRHLGSRLSGGAPKLIETTDVLVLQVTDGKDIVSEIRRIANSRRVSSDDLQFITLQGIFEPTILGLPLDLLPALPGPIRSVPLAQRKAMREATQAHRPELKPSASGETVAVAVQGNGAGEATEPGSDSLADEEIKQEVAKQSAKPAKEMWRLLEFLMERGMGTEELWVGEVPDTEILGIVEVSAAKALDAECIIVIRCMTLLTSPSVLTPHRK